jgi:hypothetical protein
VPVAENRLFVMVTLAREERGMANICPLTRSACAGRGGGQGGERWQEDYRKR